MNTERLSRVIGLAKSLGMLAGAALLTSVLSACAATSQGQVALQQQTPTGQTAPTAAAQFLGSDASLLQPGAEGQAAFIYINPNVQWSNYKKVLLKPVEFWDSPDTSVSPENQKMLTSYFFNSLKKNLEPNFTLVDQPGSGVMTLSIAIVNAEAATPGLRSVSLVVPQARILNYAQSVATGHAAFAGSAEAAFKATDSVSGQLLAESVDKRYGGMAMKGAAQIQWGDAESAMDYWSQKIAQRAVSLGAGTPAAAGQPAASN
ncbi:MAG TPA: DUF3313 domain-containing protein [Candidatus Binataceae bacterium]|nr:DUF3313 domain-containing protein [Candidatus Binataceae bacterium]HVB82339.1 DUF3313 domain-containing protein [Candidatus Binataceae bacterium]